MIRTARLLLLLLAFSAPARAGWWLENDYAMGAQDTRKDSASVFFGVKPGLVAGVNAAYYTVSGRDSVYAFRLPVMYSGKENFFSFKPFLYPDLNAAGSRAAGAKLYWMTALVPDDKDYLHLTLSGAGVSQSVKTAAAGRDAYGVSSLEAQLEKSYFGEFFMLASGAIFSHPGGNKADRVLNTFDYSDLSFLGTLAPLTSLPRGGFGVQFARNMAPEFDSYIYTGFSRIYSRDSRDSNTAIFGLRIKVTEKSSLDLAYNWLKTQNAGVRNYYKALVQVFF